MFERVVLKVIAAHLPTRFGNFFVSSSTMATTSHSSKMLSPKRTVPFRCLGSEHCRKLLHVQFVNHRRYGKIYLALEIVGMCILKPSSKHKPNGRNEEGKSTCRRPLPSAVELEDTVRLNRWYCQMYSCDIPMSCSKHSLHTPCSASSKK